ncbi:galactose mutarotase-like protein [Mycena albidolilacea]|uniref:Galactose mutarotase-like protein n=1 Tax=Mycena albidolilacea TaxID=1033008 RepID=A0AAD7AJH5_9AGAR|nr:galactose mutarotase-like protein [Mycena albidolilacea]
MRFSFYTPAYLLFASLAAFPVLSATSFSPLDITTIAAPDGSIKAGFMAFGATLTKLLVKNKHGKLVDVVPGFDNTSHWVTDGNHINGCIGRYANRIKNGTFSIPITKYPQPDGPNVYHTPLNDHNGEDTLHSGVGWDLRNWTVVDLSATSVKYLRIDDAENGFPGIVNVTVTYSVEDRGVLSMSIHATASEKTPIMVTHHDYFNLCLQDGCDDVLEHKMQIFASRRIEVDGDAIPTGNLVDVSGTPYDFRAGRALGAAFEEDRDFLGYDNALIYDKSETGEKKSGVSNVVRTTLSSDVSGIQLDIRSDQPAVQVYLASLNLPRKEVHGGPEKKYGDRSTVAIEQEGWIDAINTPEWNQNQIYSPERPFNWNTVYTFSVVR